MVNGKVIRLLDRLYFLLHRLYGYWIGYMFPGSAIRLFFRLYGYWFGYMVIGLVIWFLVW